MGGRRRHWVSNWNDVRLARRIIQLEIVVKCILGLLQLEDKFFIMIKVGLEPLVGYTRIENFNM